MKKYRKKLGFGTHAYPEGKVYDENHKVQRFRDVKELVKLYPNEWELVEDGLPEYWYIKITNENKAALAGWRTVKCLHNNNGWILSKTPSHLESELHKGYYENVFNNIPSNYKKITFNQFKKHVLNMKEEKEIIGYKPKGFVKEEALDAITKGYVDWKGVKAEKGYYCTKDNNFSINEFKDAKVLDIWFEPVYEPELTLPEISIYKGKVSQDDKTVTYGCKTIFIKTLRELLTLNVESIMIDGTEVYAKQIKQIVEYFDNL